MSTPNVFVKVGTTMARVRPENAETVRAALVKASKVPTPKQARARALMGGCGREYPRFVEGTSVEKYVIDYNVLNAKNFLYVPAHTARKAAEESAADFFQPLSTHPMFTPSGEVLEETI